MTLDGRGAGRALILGWRTGAVAAARDLTGVPPAVVYAPGDKDWYDLEPAQCDPALMVEDTADVSAVLCALERRGVRGRPWAGVVPVSEAQVVPAAVLARVLGCPGPDLEAALVCRDKAVQKDRVRRGGLRAADCVVIDDLQEVRWGRVPFPQVPPPLVVKPVAGCGTVATLRASTAAERDLAVQRLADSSGRRTFVVEPFIAMDEEWEIDAVVVDAAVRFHSVGRYARPNLEITEGDVHRHRVFDPITDADVYRLAGAHAASVVAALGIRDAVIHLEAFHVRGEYELTFGECAIRPAGGLIPDAVAYKHGVDLRSMHVALCCGMRPEPNPRPRPSAVGFTHLPSRAGVLRRHPTAAEIERRPAVVRAVVQAPPGVYLADSSAGLSVRTGMALLEAPTAAELTAAIDELIAWIGDETVIDADATGTGRPVWLIRLDEQEAGAMPA